ncbi:MAG: hypothetical protein ACRBFS_17870 [Aureispira sp.]
MSLSTKFYRNLSIVLLCLNLALLAFFFLMAPPPHKHRHHHKHAKELLQFDDQQQEQFRQYANKHKQQITTYNKEQRLLIEQYFSPLTTPDVSIQSDSLLIAIHALEKQKIQSTYQHFQEIKDILRTDQLPSFKQFVNNSMTVILRGGKKRKNSPQ